MRPRQNRLGNVIKAWGFAETYNCFNEAEAKSPRKLAVRVKLQRDRQGASMRPRQNRLGNKLGHGFILVPLIASMRPRQNRLGNNSQVTLYADTGKASMRPRQNRLGNLPGRALQCLLGAYGFNEAEAKSPRKCQAGPPGTPRCSQASMRPRQNRLGNSSRTPRRRKRKKASMRPRQNRLGNPVPVGRRGGNRVGLQ